MGLHGRMLAAPRFLDLGGVGLRLGFFGQRSSTCRAIRALETRAAQKGQGCGSEADMPPVYHMEQSRASRGLYGPRRRLPCLCIAYTIGKAMFEWDRNNLRKIRAHGIKREETEEALLNDPIPVYEQDVEGERRFVYYGETNAGRFLAVIVTERHDRIRVVTVYGLDAGQRRDYIERRTQGEWG